MTDFEQILIPEKYRDKKVASDGDMTKNAEPTVSDAADGGADKAADDKWEEILSDVKVGDIVTHKKFGDGTITWISMDKKYMRVKFPSGDKQLIFPDAFMLGFLELKQ